MIKLKLNKDNFTFKNNTLSIYMIVNNKISDSNKEYFVIKNSFENKNRFVRIKKNHFYFSNKKKSFVTIIFEIMVNKIV